MAIVKMNKLSFIGLSDDKDLIIRELMNLGVVDITDISHMADEDEWKGMVKKFKGGDELLQIESDIQKIKSAIDYLQPYDKRKKTLFKMKRSLEYDEYTSAVNESSHIWDVVHKIDEYESQLSLMRSEENKLNNQIAALNPWKPLLIPLELASTETTVITAGVVPASLDSKSLVDDLSSNVPESHIDIINSDKDQLYVLVIYYKKLEEEVQNVLKRHGFSKISFKGMSGTAEDIIKKLESQILSISKKRVEIKNSIEALADKKDILEVYYDHLTIERDRLAIVDRMLKTDRVFILEGWFPAEYGDKIEKTLKSKFDCIMEIRKPEEDEETPVLLDNPRLVQPFEAITEMYSLPNSKEVDPNTLMAPFYFIFFGMMVSDAGYGLLMSIVTGILLIKYKFEGLLDKMMRLFFLGGISTFIWGALFGGWFGDILQTVTSGKYSIPPLWFNPMDNPMKLLICSLILGAIHLFVGMGIQGYKNIREGKILDAIFDTGFWYIFLVGLALLLPGGTARTIGKYMAITGAILLVLTQGRAEKNIIKKFTKGVLSLYDAVGFMSDVLSYSRLLALGLATGVIASVINAMGTLVGFNIFGIILLIIVFLVGHIFNLVINALGAYVHSSRLQYVEFFGKFYEGGGKPYEPFKVNTKYININNRRIQ